MSSTRLEKIKSARSLADVMSIVADIAHEYKNSSAVVKHVVASLSAGEITFDARRKKPLVKKAGTTGTSVQLDKFVVPDVATLKKHTDVINKMYDNVLELDAAIATMQQAFAGNKNLASALRETKVLRASVSDSINAAFSALEDVANKHRPPKIAKFSDAVAAHLIDVLPIKSYKNIVPPSMYVVPGDNSTFHFCEYIGIEGLKNEQGFAYDIYYVVVTAVVDKKGLTQFYVNCLPDFKLPGKYPLGKNVADVKSANKQVDWLLDHNNFVADIDKLPIPFDQDRANTAGFVNIKGIESVVVEEDSFTALLSPDVKTERVAAAIELNVRARLNSIVGARRNDKVFTSKFIRRGTKRGIKYILIPNIGRKMHVTLEKLHEFSEVMGFTPEQIKAFKFALQH